MTTTCKIPGSVYFEFNQADLPPGPAGPAGGAVRSFDASAHSPKTNGATVFQPTGIAHCVTVSCPCRVLVEYSGCAGHNTNGARVFVGLARDGVAVAAGAALGAARIVDMPDLATIGFSHIDVIETPGTYIYEVLLRQSISTGTPWAYLGRSGADASPAIPNVIKVTVLEPLA